MTTNDIIGIVNGLLFELLVVILGFLIGSFLIAPIRNWWEQRQYGNWNVILKYQNDILLTRHISSTKIRQILDEPSDKSVYVKGVISPYGQLRCDPLETRGLIIEDKHIRQLTIDLDKDPHFKPFAAATPPLDNL